MSRAVAVIPARYRSTRFPGKALASLGDRTMIEVVWRNAAAARRVERVIVATDDDRIAQTATAFGAEVCMTAGDHVSGTDRVAEVIGSVATDCELVLNVQGDEPLLTPTSLDRLLAAFDRAAAPRMATLCEPIADTEELFDPNVVKVVVADDGRALYFSRSPIPYYRGGGARLVADFRAALAGRSAGLAGYRKHQGIYAYTRDTLLELTRRPPSSLELDEGLEQLRALQAGYAIHVVESDFRSHSVDTPEDLERVKAMLTEAST